MKTRLLIIIAVFLVLIPWIQALDYDPYNGVRVDGIHTSATIVMTLTIALSLLSWFLLSWASKNIKSAGIPLSIITGTSLILPFMGVMGPMAAIIVGIVAGFTAFMLQKKMINPTHTRALIIATLTIVATFFVLIIMIVAVHAASSGIGEWSGTVEGLEKQGFDNMLGYSIEFVFFLAIIPSLIITGLVIRGKSDIEK
jgi:hypothetical protein